MENFWKREMIQEFSVTNFLSFKEKTTISFLATDDRKDKDVLTYSPRRGVHLLRAAMLIGANASGKSNLLRAMGALRDIATLSTENKNEKIPVEPFILSIEKPTEFEIIFWYDGEKYHYVIQFNSDMILYERLNYYTDFEEEDGNLVFERKVESEDKQLIEFTDLSNITDYIIEIVKSTTLTNHSVLAAFHRIIHELTPINSIIKYLENNLKTISTEFNPNDIFWNDVFNNTWEYDNVKDFILSLLQKADFNITDFEFIKIRNKNYNDRLNYPNTEQRIIFSHKTVSGDTFKLDSSLESDGTRIFFELAKLLYLSNFKSNFQSRVLLIDEIDKSLHYDLLLHFLEIFLTNHNSSQLIFTTHNIALLEEEWWYRSDMLWIVEKDRETSSSTLTRASDYDFPKRLSLAQAYKVGRLGGKPDLGSTIIGLPNNEQ